MTFLHRALAIALLLLASHAPAQTPPGKLYAPGAFDRIEIDGAAQVRLTQGERDQVFVNGDTDVQDGVDIGVANGRLMLRSAGAWKFWNRNKVQVDVQVRRLSQLTLAGATDVLAPGPIRTERLAVAISGAGTVRFDDLNAGTLRFDVSGAGDGVLSGQAGELALNVSGKGKLVADRLRVRSANVAISGVGHALLWVTDRLHVGISGVGDVEYWGRPEVTRSTSGLTSVNSLGDKR
ncbi:head GIN domain-containing protein [Piscinibacter sp. XHJ-5]|uniref:head GIN domain-containing protein n=1 Tax=Piscinibacter sp. XHJ-5 TaxID=3037797 RepID=UPI0024536525|nr:head GIN domain-containing protein [Piscinibacter sp. XHJ-5]